MKNLITLLAAPVMRVTGYRFDKSFRRAESGWKFVVYKYLINTVSANLKAGL